ncbi:MAG: hypothetical protein E6I91_17495 [Chloroflexi bacterium]|nr:MAG: hypothetical protein E6I91_17495 [Chloroflexota bacterium]
MITTLRKWVFLVVMSFVLLAGLFGWTIKMETAPPIPLHPASHTLATIQPYCPPAPYDCR